ncbi:MAG TPA: hypothetical protein VFZ79_10940 [Acidimicrobiales bacterium]
MAVETVTQVRQLLAREGFVEDLVADGQQLRMLSSGRTYAPAELAVARVIRLRGITTPEEEAVLFGLATGDGQPIGAYVPPYRPAIPAEDAAIAAELHQKVSPEDEVRSHGSHDHVAAVFATRDAAQAVVDELGKHGLGTDRMGVVVREGAARVFERDADAEVLHDAAMGTAVGGAIGFLAGMAISAIVFIPGGIIGLGGILALGAGSTLGGAMVGGYIGQDTADRAFDERQELEEMHLDPGQVLVVVCSHGRPADVEELMERHGGDLVLRARQP